MAQDPGRGGRSLVVLITNDDGVLSPGLTALRDAFRGSVPFWVVAPERERSASGHAITIADPLRVQILHDDPDEHLVAISGTPADCVKLALGALMPEPPALVVAGINPGPNVGINVIYSGTVSAALEGAIFGIPSIAVSVAEERPDLLLYAASFTERLTRSILAGPPLPNGVLLNVNIPAVASAELVKGVRITVQARSRYRDSFESRKDPRGKTYYWLTGEKIEHEACPETDETALKEGYVSITPIHADLTAREWLTDFGSRGWGRLAGAEGEAFGGGERNRTAE